MDELATDIDITVKANSICELTNDDVVEGDVSNADSTMDTATENIKSDLNNILDDLFSRLDGDENLQKGVQKFVVSYQNYLSGPAPSASLASALHHFGRNYGEIIGNKIFFSDMPWSERKFGKYIAVQSTAIKRRRWGITRGNKKAGSGRPPLFKKGAQSFKQRYKPTKRKHNFIIKHIEKHAECRKVVIIQLLT